MVYLLYLECRLLVHFVERAVNLQRARPHAITIGCDLTDVVGFGEDALPREVGGLRGSPPGVKPNKKWGGGSVKKVINTNFVTENKYNSFDSLLSFKLIEKSISLQ